MESLPFLPLRCSPTKRALWTNMPPDPHAGSRILPLNGSMISTISRTIDVGVKYSPPLAPSATANLPRKYSYTLPKASPSMFPRDGVDGSQQRDKRAVAELLV